MVVLSHIVGINSLMKNDFLSKMSELNINTIDLDEMSKMILSDNQNCSPELWKSLMTKKILTHNIDHNNKYYVLIGMSNFVLDNRVRININTDNLFFVDINYDTCTSQIITYNLDYYRVNIINGKFPLEYLNYDFIKKYRQKIEASYVNKGYVLKKYDDIIKWLKETTNNIVYYVHPKRFTNKLDMKCLGNIKNYGYNTKWMALASILTKDKIRRGIINNKSPYIKEVTLGSFNELKKPIYLYEFRSNELKQVDEYRYEINSVEFMNRSYISNIYDELKRLDVEMEEKRI